MKLLVACMMLAVAASEMWTIHQLTNPGSPMGKQHCDQVSVPDCTIGHNCSTTGPAASKYWASKGWKYTTPPWNFTGPSGKIGDSPCPKIFNFLNRKIENLDNFDNVTWLEKGIVTAA